MADVLFPTNNFDAAHGGKQPNDTPNTDAIASNNYGRSRTAPTLYSDEKYVDGDGLLYGLGMVAQRVLAKPKPSNKGGTIYDGITEQHDGSDTDSGDAYALNWSLLGSTGATLGINFAGSPYLKLSGLEVVNKSEGGTIQNGLRVALHPQDNLIERSPQGLKVDAGAITEALFAQDAGGNPPHIQILAPLGNTLHTGEALIFLNMGRGLYMGYSTNESDTYNKLNLNLYHSNLGTSSVEDVQNMSGLEFADGYRTSDTAVAGGVSNASNQLRIKLENMIDTPSNHNTSGLEILEPHEEVIGGTNIGFTGGLKVKYGTGLTLDANGNLIVDAEAILEDGEGTDVQDGTTASLKINLVAPTVTTSGNTTTKTFGGVKVHDSSLTGNSFGAAYPGYIGVDSSSGEIAVKLMSASDYGVAKASAVRASAISSELIITGRTTTNRYYGVEIDQAGKLFVNVPWEDDTWRSIKINHNSTVTEVVGSATSTGDIVFFDGTGINVSSGTNSIWFDLQQATASVLGGIKAVGLEGQISSNYDSAVDGVAIDISNGNDRGKLHLKLAKDNAYGVAKLYTSIGTKNDQDQDVDIHTDGSVTQLALTNAYNNIMNAIGDLEGVEFKIAASLPTASESQKHYIYLIPISGASAPDAYAEYVCVNKGTSANPNWAWEKIGDTNIDLSGYIQFTDLPDLTLTATEVAAIVSDVFGF